MKLKHFFTVSTLSAALVSPALMAAEDAALTMQPAQKKEIEKVVHEYLVANPEVLMEVSQALQQKQQQKMKQEAQSAVKENTAQLFQNTPTMAGNPKGNVTIVEFFDYQCGHCKKMSPIMEGLLKKDANLRVIYKEFPIFGKSSELAARAALAAGMQNKYQAMNHKLLSSKKPFNEKIIMDAAKSLGLSMSKFKMDMESKQVTEALDTNRQLAEKLHLMGTPAFIIASTPNGQFKSGSEPSLIPGAASEESLQELIKSAAAS
jgi:protein-disulfide isomerase